MPQTYLSPGDFIDLWFKLKEKGFAWLLNRFGITGYKRAAAKWNNVVQSSDFWILPEVRERWNLRCTGNPDGFYEDYVVNRYLGGKTNLSLLSVGCGNGLHERRFAKHACFSEIVGIDFAGKKIEEAQKLANEAGFKNITYYLGNFYKHDFGQQKFDGVLFNSSLHHFRSIPLFLQNQVKPLLKDGGMVVIFEYVGPNRLQWTNNQLRTANRLLTELPQSYRQRFHSASVKSRIYRPGLLRMLLSDPSEAPDSENILPSKHQHFEVLEEKAIGGDILHLLLKDIAHNFLSDDPETKRLLSQLFNEEEKYLEQTQKSDYVFGVYRKSREQNKEH